MNETLSPELSPRLVKGARISFAPGQPTGRHIHPAPVVGVVTKGDFAFEVVGKPMVKLHTGDSFYEPANTTIVHFDNSSDSQSAEIVAFYLPRSDVQPLIRMLPPDEQKK